MRIRYALFVFAVTIPVLLLAAQQPTATSPQAAELLQRSLVALVGNELLTDVTLSGIARRIAGSDEDSGTFAFKALSHGDSRLDLSLSSGTRTELHTSSPNGPTGTWYGPDGISHSISQHNLWTDSSFLPTFTINSLLTNSYVISFVANETIEGQPVVHLSAMRQFQVVGAPVDWSPVALQRLTALNIYLDSTTSVPAALRFNTHPDRNDLIDIPVELRFSDYRQVNGILVPFHIQKYLNNVLAFDFQVTAANLNSGLTAASLATH